MCLHDRQRPETRDRLEETCYGENETAILVVLPFDLEITNNLHVSVLYMYKKFFCFLIAFSTFSNWTSKNYIIAFSMTFSNISGNASSIFPFSQFKKVHSAIRLLFYGFGFIQIVKK